MNTHVMSPHTRVKLAIVDGCNLSCSHCYMGEMKETQNSAPNVKRRIDEAAELGVRILDFTGGEPTQHKDIVELIDYAGSKHFSVLNLSTNGMALAKRELFEAVHRNHVTCNISMDGATEQTVDRIRGKNVFRRLEEVLSRLDAHKIRFSLRFSINKVNMREIGAIIDYGERWGAKIDMEPTQKIGNAIENQLILDATEKADVAQEIAARKPHATIEIEESFTDQIPCDGGMSDLLTVNADDQAVSCLMISRSYAIPVPEQRVSLRQQWSKIQGLKTKMRDFKPVFPACKTCEYLHICETGCHVTAHAKGCI